MTDTMVVEIGLQAMLLAVKLAGPILMVTLGLGLSIGLVQSVTQLQEPTLTFVPKFLGAGAVLLLGGAWMLREAIGFTQALFDLVPTLLSHSTTDANQFLAFERLRQRFPTWEEVRRAPVAEVEDAVRVAGLANQKAPRIQAALERARAAQAKASKKKNAASPLPDTSHP